MFFIFLFISMKYAKNIYMDVLYTDVESNREKVERIIIELYDKEVKKTCDNFYAFLKGITINGEYYTYKDSIFHRIIDDFMIQGGDIIRKDGTGSITIYNDNVSFADENFIFNHNKPGVISMANSGPDTNGSQFFITVVPTQWLNNKHVVFGKVIDDSLNSVINISKVKTDRRNRPLHPVRIVNCGDYDEGMEREL